jgi:ribosomal protein S12 methylthiotransferase
MQTFCIIALGCDKNIIDAEGTVKVLIDAGYGPVESVAEADIVVVHTCAFIDEAKEESIRVILESARDKRGGAQLVVSGCLAQRYGESLAREIPEVDLFLGVGRHAEVLGSLGKERVSVGSPDGWLSDTKNRVPSTPPHTAFVKVSEGCDNRCSYCVIPRIRGRLRSRPVSEIVDEVKWLEDMGLIELNLIAQDLASYGAEGGGDGRLVELLAAILGETDVPWIRLLYLHPAKITERLVDLMASQRRILT